MAPEAQVKERSPAETVVAAVLPDDVGLVVAEAT